MSLHAPGRHPREVKIETSRLDHPMTSTRTLVPVSFERFELEDTDSQGARLTFFFEDGVPLVVWS